MNIYQKSKKHQEQSDKVCIVVSCYIKSTNETCVMQTWGQL